MNLKSTVITIACFLLLVAQAAAAPRPLQVVRSGTDRVLQILREHPTGAQRSREEIRRVVDKYFDFERMAMSTVGPYWNKQSAQKQQEFIEAFSEFLFNTYVDRVEEYKDSDVSYEEQEIRGNYARVETVANSPDGFQLPVEYRLHIQDGSWKAYDVVIEGVSLVSNYRSQFRSILAGNSFDDLIERVRERNIDTGST